MGKAWQGLVALGILAIWMTPSIGALGVGLHLVLDHQAAHHGEHQRDLTELARASVHGHHHHADADGGHEHRAISDSAAPSLRPVLVFLALPPSPAARGVLFGERARRDQPSRRAPPLPLFSAHCSLLL